MSPEPETRRFIAGLVLAYGAVVFGSGNTIFLFYIFLFLLLLCPPFCLVRHTVMTVMTMPAGGYDYDGTVTEK